jgi:hypothetical protein
MNRTRILILAATAAVPLLGACASGGDATPEATAPEVTAPPTTSDFRDAIQPHIPQMREAAQEMGESGQAASDFDVDNAVDHARNAANLFAQLQQTASDLPGADSADGRATLHAFEVCEAANRHSAAALSTLDTDAMHDAADELGDCSAAANDAAAVVRS